MRKSVESVFDNIDTFCDEVIAVANATAEVASVTKEAFKQTRKNMARIKSLNISENTTKSVKTHNKTNKE